MSRKTLGLLSLIAAVVLVFVFVSCGGDDADGGGDTSDESYVRGLCEALNRFEDNAGLESLANAFDDPEALLEDLDPEDLDFEQLFTTLLIELFEHLALAYAELADDLDNLDAPGDIRETHEELVRRLKEFADALSAIDDDLEDLDPDTFEEIEDFDLPADIQERLVRTAQDIPEYEGLELIEPAS